MIGKEDWLEDPLVKNRGYRKLKSSNAEQDDKQSNWKLFHYTTRLKLNGANFFCAKVIDTAHTPEDELRWYLDAFLFELMSAYDILLQELNVVYELGLEIKEVRWDSGGKNNFAGQLRCKAGKELAKYIEEERRKDWFYEVQWYRNTTTHHYRNPISGTRRIGSLYLTNVHLQYIDKKGESKFKKISICKTYLSNMVNYISSVWGKMAQEFQ